MSLEVSLLDSGGHRSRRSWRVAVGPMFVKRLKAWLLMTLMHDGYLRIGRESKMTQT